MRGTTILINVMAPAFIFMGSSLATLLVNQVRVCLLPSPPLQPTPFLAQRVFVEPDVGGFVCADGLQPFSSPHYAAPESML